MQIDFQHTLQSQSWAHRRKAGLLRLTARNSVLRTKTFKYSFCIRYFLLKFLICNIKKTIINVKVACFVGKHIFFSAGNVIIMLMITRVTTYQLGQE
jgi:hypothetical protein